MNLLLAILSWTWCLPQTLLGFILTKLLKAKAVDHTFPRIYIIPPGTAPWLSGFSLGSYIVLHPSPPQDTVWHEFGHYRQSLRLGWLYLLLVGLPSVSRNLYSRILLRRGVPYKDIVSWYYSGYPENWADRLGGVKR